MRLSIWKSFDETRPGAWLLAGLVALLMALIGFQRSTDYSLAMLGFSLFAAGISAGISGGNRRPTWLPVGSLSVWLGALVLVTLNPRLGFSFEERRVLIAVSVVVFSLVFQGRWMFFAQLPIAGLYLGLRELDLGPSQVLSSSSTLGFIFSFPVAALIMMVRSSRADSNRIVARLKSLADVSQNLHSRAQSEAEALLSLRETLLGTVASVGSSISSSGGSSGGGGPGILGASEGAPGEGLKSVVQPSLSFENLIAEVRHIFSEFQIQGRALGKIAGPIRFVFFPPVAGFDEKSEIAVDIEQLRAGLWNCLQLAYESLPETGALRREGVIRLSMRHGLRVIEIAVEDNGRGIQTRSLDDQYGLQKLKREVEARGGRFERVARLGVGSRTSLEFRILTEKPANSRYRATIRHPFTVAQSMPHTAPWATSPAGASSKESSPNGDGQLV